MKSPKKTKAPVWPDQIFKVFGDLGITQVSYVPDAGHTRLINLCAGSNTMRTVSLTTEEEGIALAAGSWLGGGRSVLLMQSSGVGNCINTLSLMQECRMPMLMVVTMRGEWGEFNPWQLPMGQGTQAALESAGVIVQPVDRASKVSETVFAAGKLAFNSYRSVAVLIRQRVIGFKNWSK